MIADVIGDHDLSLDPGDVERRITPRTRAVCAVHYAGYPSPVERLRELCGAHGVALIEDAAHAPGAELCPGGPKLGTIGRAGVFSFFSNKVLSCGEGGLLATDDADVAATARSLRSHAMTSGTWDRHRGHAAGYDVVGTGYNYRLDEPRAALLLARLPALGEMISRRRAAVRRYRRLLRELDGVTVPYTDEAVELSSCYVMPVLLRDADRRDVVRRAMLERHGAQTSVLYPALHEFSAYRAEGREPLPRSERAARAQLTLPLYPHLGEERQDLVIEALRAALATE